MSADRLLLPALAAAAFLARAPLAQQAPGPSEARRTQTVTVVERTSPSVVNVCQEGGGASFVPPHAGGARSSRVSLGSGLLIDPDGYIVTNTRVLPPGTESIRVRLTDGQNLPATLISLDLDSELALLKIAQRQGEPYPAARLGTSSDLMPGEPVVVIGNPSGRGTSCVSGILSSLVGPGRSRAPGHDAKPGKEAAPDKDFILIDAAADASCSGGPLLNNDGDVIGIMLSIPGQGRGMAAAIPADRVRRSLAGRLFSPRILGEVVAGFEAGDGRELVVTSLQSDGPASRAGLRTGDRLLEVGGSPVAWEFDLNKALLSSRPGESVPLLVARGDECLPLDLILDRGESPVVQVWRRVGIQVVDHNRCKGVRVARVDPTGPAAMLGLQPGDLIDGLDEQLLDTTDDVFRSVQTRPRGSSVVVHVWRGNEAWSGPLILR